MIYSEGNPGHNNSTTNGINVADIADDMVTSQLPPAGFIGDAFKRKHLKIIMLGAGISGIQFAKDVKTRMRNIDLEIYDKNSELGGTWFENRYPGCACDIPAHTYHFSWAPNKKWTKFYAPAPEIRQYLNDVVDAHGLRGYMTFNHRATSAHWLQESSTWRVTFETTDGEGNLASVTRECHALVMGMGTLNNWKWPDIPGLANFQGHLMHTANWDESVDPKDKRIAVIGNGASAVQCVAALQPKAKKLVNYMRTASWMIPHLFSDGAVQKDYPPEVWEEFERNPEVYLAHRLKLERTLGAGFQALYSGSPAQKELQSTTLGHMKEMIKDTRVLNILTPKFEVGCRRFTPGDHYLHALQQDNTSVASDHIVSFEKNGILDTTGAVTEFDMIVCATGFDVTFAPRLEVIGQDGYSLSNNWGEDKPTEAYMGATVARFPNMFVFTPPITPVIGSAFPGIEATSDYILRVIDRLQTDNLDSLTVKEEAQVQFNQWAQSQLQKMAFAGSCKSWYKNSKGKIFVPWPGTIYHFIQATSLIRWEDFEFKWSDPSNKYASLGNGVTEEGFASESPPWLR